MCVFSPHALKQKKNEIIQPTFKTIIIIIHNHFPKYYHKTGCLQVPMSGERGMK